MSDNHFYTTNFDGEIAPILGYELESVACHVFGSQAPNTQPLFRWYNSSKGHHFYTLDPSGELAPSLGYVSEGIACYVFATPQSGTIEFWRWFQNGLMSNFTFDARIPANHRLRVMQRHSFSHFRARQCSSLNGTERRDLLAAYKKAIHHDISTDPNANASATIGGQQISINFVNLFPLGDDEIAQTLIHEMLHIAGYTHPPKQTTDVSGDNGLYYGSPPLRGEFCIAGTQSDAGLLSLRHSRLLTLDGVSLIVEETAKPVACGCQVLGENR